MTTAMILRTLFEVFLVGFTVWALFHEDSIALLERKVFAHIRRLRFKVLSSENPKCNRV